MRVQRLSRILNVITANTEAHLFTSLSLQADKVKKKLYLFNLYIDQFIDNEYRSYVVRR